MPGARRLMQEVVAHLEDLEAEDPTDAEVREALVGARTLVSKFEAKDK